MVAGICSLPANGQTHLYTGPPNLLQYWEDITNWISPPGSPQYPTNGDSAQISTAWLSLQTDPSITDLNLSSPATSFFLLENRTLQIDGTFDFFSAEFQKGTLIAEKVEYQTSLTLDRVNATFSNFDSDNGILTLANRSVLRNTGQFLIPSTGIIEQGNNNQVENRGTFIKSGDGIARIPMPFTQSSGTLDVRKGTLRMSGDTTIAGGGLASAGALEFQGLTVIPQNLAIQTSGDGYVSFEQLVTISGALASSGTPGGAGHVRMSNTFFADSLLLSDDAPLVMLRGKQGSTQTLINQGAIIWEGGQLGPLTNEATSRGSFVIKTNPFGISNPSDLDPSINGTFLNNGYLLQEGRALTLEPNGNLISQGTYEMSGGSIEKTIPGSPGKFRSLGLLKKTALDGTETTAAIKVPLEASDIQVESGQLSLQGEAELSGTIVVDDGEGMDSKLLLESGAEKIVLENVLFQGVAGGEVVVGDAWVELAGALTTAGTEGLFHLRNQDARLATPAGEVVTIQASEQSPFLVGDDENSPVIEPSGELQNSGVMVLNQARLSGSALINAGTLSLNENLEFISTTGTGPELRNENSGVFSQDGVIDLGETGKLIIGAGNHNMGRGASVGHSVSSTDTTYQLGADAVLSFQGSAVSPRELAADTITIDGLVNVFSGELSIDATTDFELRSGDIQVQAEAKLSLNDPISGSGADFLVFGILSSIEPLAIPNGASLNGNGLVIGAVTQTGTIVPRGLLDGDPGTLMIDGDLLQTADAQTRIGISPASQSSISLTGSAQLAGTLVVDVFEISNIPVDVPFAILTADSLSGEFGTFIVESSDPSAADQFSLEYTGTQVLLTRSFDGPGYDTWVEQSFGGITDPEVIGSTKDPDKDGVENAFEYLQGTDPLLRGGELDLILEFVPGDDDPEQTYLRVRLAIAPNRSGYDLNLIDLRDLEDPDDDQVLPTDLQITEDEAIFTSISPLVFDARLYAVSLTIN